MIRKITYVMAFVMILGVILSFTTNTLKIRNNKPAPDIVITGDEPRNPNSVMYTGSLDAVNNGIPNTITYSDSIVSVTDVYMGVWSIYDLQSNAVPQYLYQWYKDTIHATFMQNMTPGWPGADRKSLYLVSTDAGATWTNLGAVGTSSSISSGYPAIYCFDDGRAIVGTHSIEGGLGQHPTLYHDIAPLVGVFNLCDPGGVAATTTRVWLRMVATSTGKVPFICAYNPTGGADTVTWLNVLTNPTNCTFSGYVVKNDMDNAEQYSIARAQDGTLGIAYISNDFVVANGMDVKYMKSTDEGLTWGAPITVYDATPAAQFIGPGRSVDLVYVGNTPKITFGMYWQTNAGTYYPGLNGRIMFWSPDINGGNALLVADSTKVPDHPIQSAGAINDVYVNICRATIGKSRNEQILYCAFGVAREEVSPNVDSTPYFDVYFTWSNDQGATWQGYKQLTNPTNAAPFRDCRYQSMAPVNDNDANFYYANIVYQSDSIPGSAVNGAAESPAKARFIRVKLPSVIGVKNIGTEVPENYSLHQNFPNPFNPSTKIRFEIPSSEFVVLKVYDVVGREIAVLVNEKLTAGIKEFSFNAVNLPSGVYFYELRAGNFKETKKMVLIK